MPYTLANLLSDVNTRTANETGTATPAIITTYANESLRRLRRKFDVPSAEVVTQISLMTGVNFYAVPYAGYKEFVALRDNYRLNDSIFMRNVSEDVFWSQLQTGNLKSESRNGLGRRLLFNFITPGTNSMQVNPLSGVDTDGTWVGSGDASNLATDHLFYREGSSSLSFTITPATGTATLTNSTMSPRDLSGIAFNGTAIFTLWPYFPSSVAYTGFTYRFGSSASDYVQITTTNQIDNSSLVMGWNQLGFDWLTATTVGSPTLSAVTYAQISMTFPTTIGVQDGVRLNALYARQRRLMNLHSTTDYLVIDGATATPKETFTSASDTSSYINLDLSFTDYVLYETLEQIFTTHIDNQDARAYYTSKRIELEQDLLMRFPSKRQPEMQIWMDDSVHDAWIRRGNNR